MLATGEPRWIGASEPHGHDAEVRILEELGMSSVLLLTLRAGGEPWGLVEVYRDGGRGFTRDDAAVAAKLVAG